MESLDVTGKPKGVVKSPTVLPSKANTINMSVYALFLD
jgi:hypothetical protein